jgi:signal recognition particle receptor subunit alpha
MLTDVAAIKTTVKAAMEDALKRILTPKRNIDILRGAMQAAEEGRPYVIAFVGVNGVGKSTNLAKVMSNVFFNLTRCSGLLLPEATATFGFDCRWVTLFCISDFRVACDTFRSGAVEQLVVHAKRLNVELFEKGYRDDPTVIALDAIRQGITF